MSMGVNERSTMSMLSSRVLPPPTSTKDSAAPYRMRGPHTASIGFKRSYTRSPVPSYEEAISVPATATATGTIRGFPQRSKPIQIPIPAINSDFIKKSEDEEDKECLRLPSMQTPADNEGYGPPMHPTQYQAPNTTSPSFPYAPISSRPSTTQSLSLSPNPQARTMSYSPSVSGMGSPPGTWRSPEYDQEHDSHPSEGGYDYDDSMEVEPRHPNPNPNYARIKLEVDDAQTNDSGEVQRTRQKRRGIEKKSRLRRADALESLRQLVHREKTDAGMMNPSSASAEQHVIQLTGGAHAPPRKDTQADTCNDACQIILRLRRDKDELQRQVLELQRHLARHAQTCQYPNLGLVQGNVAYRGAADEGRA